MGTCCHSARYSAAQPYAAVAECAAGASHHGPQGLVQITPKGTVYYHAPVCSLPPAYESVFRIDHHGNPIPIQESDIHPVYDVEPDLIQTTRASRSHMDTPNQPIRLQQVTCVREQHQQPIREGVIYSGQNRPINDGHSASGGCSSHMIRGNIPPGSPAHVHRCSCNNSDSRSNIYDEHGH